MESIDKSHRDSFIDMKECKCTYSYGLNAHARRESHGQVSLIRNQRTQTCPSDPNITDDLDHSPYVVGDHYTADNKNMT